MVLASTSKPVKKVTTKAKPSLKAELLSTQKTDEMPMDDEFEREPLVDADADDEEMLIDPSTVLVPVSASNEMQVDDAPLSFPALKHHSTAPNTTASRRVGIPPHRFTPLKKDWMAVYTPLVDECGLQVRMNPKRRSVEIKTSKHTPQPQATILQKAVDFLNAYSNGFAVEDAIALLRMDDLYIETFEVKDVKMLHGDHLSRAIGRIAGQNGKTRYTIENASRTRIVLADSRIHILGTFSAIKIARDAVCALILGSPPGKVYGNLRNVVARQRSRF